MGGIFEAEDERDGDGGLFAEGEQRQPRSHIADIAVGAGQRLDC
jgi:hypothetical protein